MTSETRKADSSDSETPKAKTTKSKTTKSKTTKSKTMSRYLYRLGRFSFRHPWAVLGTWLVVLLGVGGAGLGLGGQPVDNFSIPGTESQRAIELLQEKLPTFAGAQTQVAFAAQGDATLTDPRVAAAIQESIANVNAIPQVAMAAGPAETRLASPDGRVALGTVQYATQIGGVADATLQALQRAMDPAEAAGVQVDYSGSIYPGFKISIPVEPEIIGIAIAFIILLITFGAVVAAGLPILTAGIGVGVGALGILAAAALTDIPSAALSLALMLGLACGIDYALLVLTRHRNNLLLLMDPEDSAALAIGTAGSSVVFAALTVIIALCGLSLVGIPFLTAMALAAAAAVFIAMLVVLTLLPALLNFAGTKVAKFVSTPLRPGHAKQVAQIATYTPQRTLGASWARFVVRFRKQLLLVGVAALAVLGLPALGMHFGLPSGATQPESSTARQAYDLTAQHLGPGFNGPLLVIADLSGAPDPTAVGSITAALQAEPGVLHAAPAASQNDVAVIQVIPETGPTDPATADLVTTIRDDRQTIEGSTGAAILVGGPTASNIDTSEKLAEALPIFLLVVVGLAFILLTVAFRAALVPITSIIGFLLSVFAALGVQVAIVQWGWGASLLGIIPGPTISFLPIIVLAIIFGLSSDYQIFVVSRIKEEYVKSDDALEAIRLGVGLSARVIAAAAAIMVGIFLAFLVATDPIIKSVALTLAVGVLLDAFVVRLTLIPAIMAVLGRRMWVHSRWFGKVVPDLDIEGTALDAEHRRAAGVEVP
ncbi:MMPL family transporter [Mycolicibacterium sp. XJ2546]